MAIKKLLFLGLIGLFLLPNLVLGSVIYTREPSDFSVYSPVSFSVSGVFDNYPTKQSYKIRLGGYWQLFESECYTTNDATWNVDLPPSQDGITKYVWVRLDLYDDTACSENVENYHLEIIDGEQPIFEVLEGNGGEPTPPISNKWFDLSGTFMDNLKATISDLSGDLGLYLTIIIGLPLAFWFIYRVIGLIRMREKT